MTFLRRPEYVLKMSVSAGKVLLNDIFEELDGSSGIKNIITDRLNLGKLHK